MKIPLLDANVIVRFFTERHNSHAQPHQDVFSFFVKIASGEIAAEIPDIIMLEVFYVLTRIYGEHPKEVAESLITLVSFKGIVTADKELVIECFSILKKHTIGFADAYLIALSGKRHNHDIYSYDKDIKKLGLKLRPIG